MNTIPGRSRVEYTHFKKLPRGAVYYANRTSGPFVKIAANRQLEANVVPQTHPAQTTVSDVRAEVIRVGKFLLGGQRAL